MGRRCSKKAVRCGAIGVLVLASASGDFSLATRDAALRRGFLAVPWHPLGQVLCCLRRLSPQFALTVICTFPWQIVLPVRQSPASAPAPLPDTPNVLQHICSTICCG